MDDCKYYPIFEDNQVLTAGHLNRLSSYLNGQDRNTRRSLLGIGIACGLEISRDELDKPTLHISKGLGITSAGYLVHVSESVMTAYRPYIDPVGYEAFQQAGDQITLWELLPASQDLAADDKIKALDRAVLKGMAVMLYLECLDVDIGVCTGSNCDEKGRRFELCVKLLLIKQTDLEWMLQQGASNKLLKQQIQCRFQLPHIRVGRKLDLYGYGNAIDFNDISGAYRALIERFGVSLIEALGLAEQCHHLLVHDEHHEISLHADSLQEKIKSMIDHHRFSIQYCYDFLKDLELAYEEYRETLFKLSVQCCPDSRLFPKHLMLGSLSGHEDCKAVPYRQSFLYAPILNDQKQVFEKIRHLYLRMQLMIQYVEMPALSEDRKSKRSEIQTEIRITPGRSRSERLGQREIAYYYSHQGFQALSKSWNYDLYRSCSSETVLSYYQYDNRSVAEFVQKPLEYNLDHYDFFRIEGHIGKRLPTAMRAVEKQIQQLNLPFKILALKLGELSKYDDYDCRFEDIQLAYSQLRSELTCLMRQEIVFFANLKTIEPAPVFTPKPGVTGIEGIISNESGRVIANARIVVSHRQNRWGGRLNKRARHTPWADQSDAKGNYKIIHMTPGNYNMSVQADGYTTQNISFVVNKDHVLNKAVQLSKAISDRPLLSYPIMTLAAPFKESVVKTGTVGRVLAAEKSSMETSRAVLRNPVTASLGAKDMPMKRVVPQAIIGQSPTAEVAYVARGKFMGESLTATPLRYSVGDVYQSYNESGRRDELFSFATQFMADVSKELMEKNYFFHIRYPMQIIEAIEDLVESLPEHMETFQADSFHLIYNHLQELANHYLEQVELIDRKAGAAKQSYDQDLVEHLKGLLTHCSIAKFKALIAAFKQRIEEIKALTSFHPYLKKHPGLEHLAGVCTGGTFLFVYDDSGVVVADFALPYICCSDCPPVSICFVEPKKTVLFSLPQERFCRDDKASFKFSISPLGGKLEGNGTYQDGVNGDWYFKPSHADVKKGNNELRYLIDGEVHSLHVMVDELEIIIHHDVIAVDKQAKKAIVKFSSEPIDADSYRWDFGDGQTSKGAKLEHEFDLSGKQQFTVSLSVVKGACNDGVEKILTFPMCSAAFKMDRDASARGDKTVRVRFSAEMLDAEQYEWNFDDGGGKVAGKSIMQHIFKRSDVEQQFRVRLNVSKGSCRDRTKQIVVVPPFKQPEPAPIEPSPPSRTLSDPAPTVRVPTIAPVVDPALIARAPTPVDPAPIVRAPRVADPILIEPSPMRRPAGSTLATPVPARSQPDPWQDGFVSKEINGYVAGLEKMQADRQFRKVFRGGDIFARSSNYIVSIAEVVGIPNEAELYAAGKVNDDLAINFENLLQGSHQQVISLRANATRQKAFAYQLTLILTAALLTLSSLQRQDLKANDPLLSTCFMLIELLSDLKAKGIGINPAASLASDIQVAKKVSVHKPELSNILKQLSALL